jgi:hypothetical protein
MQELFLIFSIFSQSAYPPHILAIVKTQRRSAMEQSNAPQGTGYLIVQATTANTAIPLEGAFVRISRDAEGGSAVLYELRTGRDGRTERISLSAPPRSSSLSPGGGTAFSAYNIEVTLPGYGDTVYQHVPIFDGITSIQGADLIPLPQNGVPDLVGQESPRLFDSERSYLL